jgi:hypothetical protein
MMERGNNYHAYLLRLWRENEMAPWRLTLQDSQTGERIGFADLGKLTNFLEDKTEGRLIDFGLPPYE